MSAAAGRNAWRRWGLSCAIGGLAPAILLAPVAGTVAGGFAGTRGPTLGVLLLEVVYVVGAYGCLGLAPRRCGTAVRAASVLALVPLCAFVLLAAAGTDLAAASDAQPIAAAAAILGWGAGRAARRACPRPGVAGALTFVGLASICIGLLPVSHLAPHLESWPRLQGLLLAFNPLVAVAAGAGYDLVRSPALYDALALSSYRFRYPSPLESTLALAGLGLALAHIPFRTSLPLHSTSTEVLR